MKVPADSAFHRSSLSPSERKFRSRVAPLASRQWFLGGTLCERFRKCGKSSCHCAQGDPHKSLHLVQSQAGKPRQICVPKGWEQRVRQAVSSYQQMQQFLEEVSELEWKRLRGRKR